MSSKLVGSNQNVISTNGSIIETRVRTQSFNSGERVNNMKVVGHGYNKPRWVRKNFVPPLRPSYTRKLLSLF